MASARSTATIEVRTTRPGDEQGISRLAMLAFLRGEHGPWNGSDEPTKTQWVRYRSHHIERYFVPGEGRIIRLTYHDHADETRTEKFAVRTSGLAMLRDLDDLLDIVLAAHPLATTGHGPNYDELRAAFDLIEAHPVIVELREHGHDDLAAPVIVLADELVRRELTDEGAPAYTTAEGTTVSDVLAAGALVERLEGILRHVHDLVKRGASLDEIEAGLHAARSADQRITPADRDRAEVDLEVDGEAIARAEDWADDGSDLTARERNEGER